MFARKGDDWVRLIALFKLFKGLLFLLVRLGFATVIQRDMAEQIIGWMRLLSLRQENHYIDLLLSWATGFNRRDMGVLEFSISIYAALLFTEGVGLLWLKPWAEYLTVVTTTAFIPLEVWSDVRRFGPTKTMILVLNILAVWYLSVRLWTSRHEARSR